MKLTYGNSYCTLEYGVENISNIVISYRGNITIKHHHMEFIKKVGKNRALFFNFGEKSLLIKSYNKIRIGYNKEISGKVELFRWIGEFKILSAKVNGKRISVEVTNADYWNLIDSKWDSAGKPEQYKGQYFVGNIPKRRIVFKKRARGRLPAKTTTRRSGGGY